MSTARPSRSTSRRSGVRASCRNTDQHFALSGKTVMNKEILLVGDAVSNEKGVDKEVIFEAIEAALASATRKKQGGDIDARVAIDRQNGSYETFRRWLVVEDDAEIEFPEKEITVSEARQKAPGVEVGGYIEEPTEDRKGGVQG